MELGNLCPDLIETIFSHIPLVSLTRLKAVSKSWYNFITTLRHSSPISTSTGLVIFLKNTNMDPLNLHETTFIKLQDQTHNQEPTLHASFNHKFPWLIDSCNGLLLYATKDINFVYWEYYIYNPVHNKCISLPCSNELSRHVRESLAFDGFGHNKFRVFCYFWNEVDFDLGMIKFKIFDSGLWEWRENWARIENSNLLLNDGFVLGECFSPSVYRRRKLYWLWSLCMLVYEDDGEFFELIELPNCKYSTKTSAYISKLLWVSEDVIHYCEGNEEFNIYTYIEDEDDIYNNSRWRFKWRIVLGQLNLRWGYFRIFPCAFNEDLQVLYFQGKGTIFAYSFEFQRFEEVWYFGEPGEDYYMYRIYSFLFNSQEFEVKVIN